MRYIVLAAVCGALVAGCVAPTSNNDDTPNPSADAYIYNARFTNSVDNDDDGFPSEFDIEFDIDADVTGSISVYVEIWGRTSGSSTYSLIGTVGPYTITGTETDYRTVGLTGGSHGSHDYRLDVYSSATDQRLDSYDLDDDPDLDAHAEETPAEDVASTASVYIYDAELTNQFDYDGDGYPSEFDIEYDPDVSGGASATVYVELYGRVDGVSAWSYITVSNNLSLVGVSATSYSFSLYGGSHGYHDFELRVYDATTDVLLDTYGPTDDSDLDDHMEENQDDDPDIYIYDADFENELDYDLDGYPSEFDLIFDPDIGNDSTYSLYVELYGRVDGAATWALITTTSDLTITGSTSIDYSIGLYGGSHGLHDFRLDLYNADTDILVDSYGPTDDSDLDDHMEEPTSED